MVTQIVKHILATLKRKLKSAFFSEKFAYAKEIKALSSSGIFVLKDLLISPGQCAKYRKKIDHLIDGGDVNVWTDATGSDSRIFFAEGLDEGFNDLFESKYVHDILKGYLGVGKPCGFLMAARIQYSEENLGSGGGWHRDSPYSNQLKAICYLSDVDESNGPFQIIKNSHSFTNILKSSLGKVFRLGGYRYNDNEIEAFFKKFGFKPTSLLGPQGTFSLIDTKAVHRGKPLISGSRYALFWYYWDKDIPAHFDRLRQS